MSLKRQYVIFDRRFNKLATYTLEDNKLVAIGGSSTLEFEDLFDDSYAVSRETLIGIMIELRGEENMEKVGCHYRGCWENLNGKIAYHDGHDYFCEHHFETVWSNVRQQYVDNQGNTFDKVMLDTDGSEYKEYKGE